MAFAGSLQQGKLHRGRPPSTTVIETMLQEVTRFLDSRGLGNPRRSTPGQPFLDAPFANMIRRWKGEDPGPKPQQVLPSSAVHQIAKVYGTSPILRRRIMSDLVVVAYFFLLRVGEYTLTTPHRGGAAQMHCPSLKGAHHILAPDKGDPRRLTPGTPPQSRWGHYKPGQPEERSEGCQSISHPIRGSNHMPMQVFSQIGGCPFWPPRQHRTQNLLHCNQNFPGYRP
jgi:hypothetical protein